jgi:hypothetical protein
VFCQNQNQNQNQSQSHSFKRQQKNSIDSVCLLPALAFIYLGLCMATGILQRQAPQPQDLPAHALQL